VLVGVGVIVLVGVGVGVTSKYELGFITNVSEVIPV
jgi:hypothetical protein